MGIKIKEQNKTHICMKIKLMCETKYASEKINCKKYVYENKSKCVKIKINR